MNYNREVIIRNHKVLSNRIKKLKRKLKRKQIQSIDINILKHELAECEKRKSTVWSGESWSYAHDGGESASRLEIELNAQIELLKRLIGNK